MSTHEDETPLHPHAAILVAAPMADDPLGPPERRPTLAAAMRRIADVADRVGRERTFDGTRRISWEMPAGDDDGCALSLVADRNRTASAMAVTVELYADPRGRSRGRLTPDDGSRPLLVLNTRIASGGDLRDHVSADTLPLLAAFAHAAAAALEGTAPMLGTMDWEDACDAIIGDAWLRHASDSGRRPGSARITHAPATPLERRIVSAVTLTVKGRFEAPVMPAVMEMHVGHDGIVRMEAMHRNHMFRSAPDPMAVLRATALIDGAALAVRGASA
jgi:hypothetical protein